jgi:hypothetical protein
VPDSGYTNEASVTTPADAVGAGVSDIQCFGTCGTFARPTENDLIFADGITYPQLWNGVSGATTELTTAKILPFVVVSANRVFLYGSEPYNTGRVATTAGVATVTHDTTDWPATVVGKPISVDGVTWGGKCSATIVSVAGKVATVTAAASATVSSAVYVVFRGTSGDILQWTDAGSPSSFRTATFAVGQTDGDISTGAFAIGTSVYCAKRSILYRFDWFPDPEDEPNLAVVTDLHGMVGAKSVAVVEGTAYVMDQNKPYLYATRGGQLFSFEIGGPIANALQPGGVAELDWDAGSCWFAWHSPIPDSICWAATLKGEPLPRVVIEYFRPAIEGSGEAGVLALRVYNHYLLDAVNTIFPDGTRKVALLVADPNDTTKTWLAHDEGLFGDMAAVAQSGTVTQIDNGNLVVGAHTPLQAGDLVEVSTGRIFSVSGDDGNTITLVNKATADVAGLTWRAGWRPTVRWRSIWLSPEPIWALTDVQELALAFTRVSAEALLKVRTYNEDGPGLWDTVLGGGREDGSADITEATARVAPGTRGYQVGIEIQLESPQGQDMVHAAYATVRKRWDETSRPRE